MARQRRDFLVHFLVVRDGNQYSALCYEYNIATCARTVQGALRDLVAATIAYLDTYLEKGQDPKPRPASRELLLEFVDLDPTCESFSREEVEKVLRSVYGGNARLRAPLVYRLREHGFAPPLTGASRRLRTGSYPVAICYA